MLLFPLCGCLHLKHPTDRSRCVKARGNILGYAHIGAHRMEQTDGRQTDGRQTDGRQTDEIVLHTVTCVASHTDLIYGENIFTPGWWVLKNHR